MNVYPPRFSPRCSHYCKNDYADINLTSNCFYPQKFQPPILNDKTWSVGDQGHPVINSQGPLNMALPPEPPLYRSVRPLTARSTALNQQQSERCWSGLLITHTHTQPLSDHAAPQTHSSVMWEETQIRRSERSECEQQTLLIRTSAGSIKAMSTAIRGPLQLKKGSVSQPSSVNLVCYSTF